MKIEKKQIYIVIGLVIVVFALFFQFFLREDTTEDPIFATSKVVDQETKKYIVVDIKGEVMNQGVYKLEEGTRLYQLIIKAGGLSVDANSEIINQSVILEDEMQIYIPSIFDEDNVTVIVDSEKEDTANTNTGLININTASKDELTSIPGVGEVTAESIISYREENEFISIEDIMNVSGIGETTFEKIKKYITVS